jgi:hypothetical protein
MKDKQYDPAGNNEKSPAPGMAAVNTFNEGEDVNDIEEGNKKMDEHSDKKISKPASEKQD